MNGVLKPHQDEQRVFAANNKQNRMKIQKKNSRSKFMSNPCEINVGTYAGLMNLPPSYPFELSSSFYCYHQKQQPPLLPLPTVSASAVNRGKNRGKEISNRKPKQSMREELTKKPTMGLRTTPVAYTSSFRSTAGKGFGYGTENVDFSSWVFNLSPPPSSLPVPKFCVRRSKLSCNAETH
ncbi:hypothetical protein PHAVU_001G005800 [Phaseolus vulgaris]|uniref:Uncharacterized protein n=1 Tax=Phaseolus vulgaris TaxID=3885 RepID=V7CUU3_PHAVU|nr:hypothetical protein PHAVU_001G005800g [Phaseolus vulgaris]ESW32651.1 hypothetical protein PHAVU_001G005800g [Phaseolus vulgaris]